MATMKMTGCMALVARMPQADQDALLARLDQYQADGIPAERAQVMATNDMLEELRAERSQIFSAIADQFPDLLTVAEAPAASQRQTDTPEFKRWFGDSKVVDSAGRPMVMYHGTNSNENGDAFTMFDTYGSNYGLMGMGSYFTREPLIASEYTRKGRGDTPTVYPVYLSIQNPLDMEAKADAAAWIKAFPDAEAFHEGGDTNESWYRAAEEAMQDAQVPAYEGADAMQEGIRSMGYDGITHIGGGRVNKIDGIRHRVFIAFDPTQVKSAIGNSGAFDPANPDIRASRRERTPLGFYSALADSVDGIKTNSAPAQGWKDAIKGLVNKGQVKADEVEWSGINDWLDLQQGRVTKEQVAQYLQQGGVRVEEVVNADNADDKEAAFINRWEKRAAAAGLDFGITNNGVLQFMDDYELDDLMQQDWASEEQKALAREMQTAWRGMASTGTAPKYGQYQLPGGENYREVLLRLPRRAKDMDASNEFARRMTKKYKNDDWYSEDATPEEKREFDRLSEAAVGYRSSHWDQLNVIAHIRVNDRTDADGKRVLFVEELQSDWGQEGKKRGFGQKEPSVKPGEREALIAQMKDLAAKRMVEAGGVEEAVAKRIADKTGHPALAVMAGMRAQYDDLLAREAKDRAATTAPPAAPFVTKTEGWLNLALKRVMVMAAEGGYDKVAFVNGEQSADRYDLSKQIGSIRVLGQRLVDGEFKYAVSARKPDGEGVVNDSYSADELPDLLGKELAERIVAEVTPDSPFKEYRGLDLKVGGKGMETFYDSIVPLAVKKLLPKVGGGQMGVVRFGGEDVESKYIIDASDDAGALDLQQEVIVRDRNTFDGVAPAFDTVREAQAWLDENDVDVGALNQPGFDVTDAMREKVGEGLPMFSRRQRQASGLLVGRDEVGRVNFAPGAKAYDIVANIANKVLDVASMKPVSDELGRAMRNMKVEVEKVQNQIAMTAEELAKIPQAEREMISDVIEGELKAGVLPPQRVLQVAASMQSIMSEQSRELVRLGMLSQEAADRWDMKYLPRFYESKLGDEVKAWSKAAKALLGRQPMMQGIRGSSLKARGMFETIEVADLPAWQAEGWEQRDPNFDPATSTQTVVWRDYTRKEREDMGEIRDAMFRFVMGYNRSQRDIALGRLYESLAQNYAVKGPKDGYVEVPATKVEGTIAPRYGKLAGKYVPKEIMDHLSVNDESMMEGLFKIYKAGLAKWKEGKTVLNPVSHANNVISNITMAHFAGVSYWDAQKYAGAVKDLLTKDPMVQEAKDIGLFTGTFNQSELVASMPPQLRAMAGMSESKLAKMGEGIWDVLAYTVSWNGKKYGARPVMQWAYENEDLFFRYLVYRDARQRGMEPEDAREYSQQFLFTYDDLPKGARIVRDVGLPFFSYTYKVVPVLARTALEYPWRLAAPAAVAWGANAMMYAMAASLGGDEDDWWGKVLYRYATDSEFRERAKQLEAGERKNLPPYSKGTSAIGTPKAIRLGMDDVTGLPLFLDISKIFPGGDLFDATSNAGGVPLLQPITPSNPVLTTAVAMLANRDLFTGKDVVNKDADTDAEAAQKRAAWLWKQFTPAIAVGNYHFDRGMNVIANMTGQPITLDAGPLGVIDYTGTGRDGLPVQPKYAALQTFGIKVRPYDLEMSEKLNEADKRRTIRELDEQIRRINRLEQRGAKSSEAADLERDRVREKRDRVREGLTVDGEEKQ